MAQPNPELQERLDELQRELEVSSQLPLPPPHPFVNPLLSSRVPRRDARLAGYAQDTHASGSIPKCNPADVTYSHGRRETSQRRGKSPVACCLSPTACPLANHPGTAIGSKSAEPSYSPFTSRKKMPRRRLWAALDCTRPRATRLREAVSAYTHPTVMNILRATAIGGLP